MALTTENKGQHYELIKSHIDPVFTDMSLSRSDALRNIDPQRKAWATTATERQHKRLKTLNKQAWSSQNKIDKKLARLKDVYSFAEPLLRKQLLEQFDIDVDVKNTYIRLYISTGGPLAGYTTRTTSLLDTALHNFAYNEEFDKDSNFLLKTDPVRELFDTSPIRKKITFPQFKTLCRELDIGAQYKAHLESYLLAGEPVADTYLEIQVQQSHQAALKAAADIALIKNDISLSAHTLVRDLLFDRKDLTLDGQPMQVCDLGLMDLTLTGIFLITPKTDQAQRSQRVLAYVPHDPEHPLKEYASSLLFMSELTRQLRENKTLPSTGINYRQFFSQFVDHQQRGHFFSGLEQRLFHVKWHPREPGDPRPSWRSTPVDNPRLQFSAMPITQPLWTHLYQQRLSKILNDARSIAVPTADADNNARWAWWENFKRITSDIFNVALLVLTPFVPGLGELMLAYTAYQLTTEVVEGVVDLAEGQWIEASEHVVGVVTDVLQLAAFSAGAAIGNEFRLKLSPLVESMKPVQSSDGKTRLWNPDLAPYEQKDLRLPDTSKPDAKGLHQHSGKTILSLDSRHFEVTRDPASGEHRIQHPTRPEAYAPKLRHNGQGAWAHEGENPAQWQGETLMRRLGHSVERFSPIEREHIRISSGTDDNELRWMHVEHAPPPPLLADAITRASALDSARMASANIRSGRPLDPMSVWFESLLIDLPGWPAEKALRVYERTDLSGQSRRHGNATATDANTLSIGLPELLSGKFADRVLGFLNELEILDLVGSDVAPVDRVQMLRNRLADSADRRRGDISRFIYQASQRSDNADVQLLKRTFTDLPLPIAEKVLAQATPNELQRIKVERRLPLRLKTLAREVDFEALTARAYDGFYHEQWMTADTERLALNTLKFYSDSFADLRIEVRDGTYDGPLRSSTGPHDAATVRRLIRDEHGRYEVLDADNHALQQAGDFYDAILQALPPQKRSQLGYQTGHGRLFKQWIMAQSAAPTERRTVLAESPVRAVPAHETETLLRMPFWFFGETTPEESIRQLYPSLNEPQRTEFLRVLRTHGDPVPIINRLNEDFKQLRSTLEQWERSQAPDIDFDSIGDPHIRASSDFYRNGGSHIKDRLLECFQRQSEAFGERSVHPDGGYTLDLSFELSSQDLGRWWRQVRKLPRIQVYLEQITVLKLDNARFSATDPGLLRDFPNLRRLSARHSALTNVPASLGQLRLLKTLDLAGNRIMLDADAIEQMNRLTSLEMLRLDDNPLSQPPDIGYMPDLKVLQLAKTGIEAWPPGLFMGQAGAKSRPRGFSLDMRQCPINQLPQVTPGSDHAFILSRTRFSTMRLTDADRIRFGDYRESVGFARQQAFSGAVEDELAHWKLPSPSDGFESYREESWQDVMAEPGSTDFFRVIRQLRNSQDYQVTPSRRRLTERVWQMIDTMALDSELREELFSQARQPETCADAGSQLFNNMGIKVLVSRAYEQPTSATLLEDRLVRLARSAARLERVGDVARAEITSQQRLFDENPHFFTAPDDVEVHLAYETGLAKRLDLPWQSEDLLYEARSGVTQDKIDTAYKTITEREAGDGLVNGMLELFEHPFWENYLRQTYPERFAENDRLFAEKLEQLEDLREAQRDWATNQDSAQTTRLHHKLQERARTLEVAEKDVFSGEEMTDAFYNRLLSDIGHARDGLARRLTREALNRAGLG